MKRTFLIADPHFGDSRIIGYEGRPFAGTKEMEEELIRRWNETVDQDSRVFVLGDFSACGREDNRRILSLLAGEKYLIMGNHDRHFTSEQWEEMGFIHASYWPVLFENWYWLSHEPLYLNRNMPYANIFGHVHASPQYTDVSRQSFCVSAERMDYRPAAWEEIMMRMKEARMEEER